MTIRKKTAEKIDFEKFVYGQEQPKSLEFEAVVLGALMMDSSAYTKVERILKSDDVFYDDKHQKVFKYIKVCMEKYQAADHMLVTDELRKAGELESLGGAFYVTELTTKVASTANIAYHAKIIFQCYVSRVIIGSCSELVRKAFSEDAFETLDEAEKVLMDTRATIASMREVDFARQLSDTIVFIQEAGQGKRMGCPTGKANSDAITGGRVDGELTIVAARPGMGKTSFIIDEATHIALGSDTPVGIISLEMTSKQLITKTLSNVAEIDSDRIRNGKLTSYEVERLIHYSAQLKNIHINDVTDLTITEIRGIIRKWVEVYGVKIFYLDYLGLVKWQNQNGREVEELGKISRGLKTICGECKIPGVALHQLNRSVETRGGDKRPALSDFRGSGRIEEDADVAIMLYRPEYYNINTDSEGASLIGLCEEHILKNRNGKIGVCAHTFKREFSQFIPIEKWRQNKLSPQNNYPAESAESRERESPMW